MEKDTLDQINQLINQAKDITIACGQNFDSDTIAAGLSLYLSLLKLGKNVEIVTSQPTTVEFAKYVGIDKVVHELSSRKFIITLKNVLGNVDKVTHYLEENELNIVVHPLPGATKFTQDNVTFRYDKPSIQLIILLGVYNFEDLGKIYIQEQEIFANTPILAINKGKNTTDLSPLVMGDNKLTVSESVVRLIAQLKLPIDVDIASNLFLGISAATNNFQDPNLTPESLEAAAFCLRTKGQQPTRANFASQLATDQDKAGLSQAMENPQEQINKDQLVATSQQEKTAEQPKEDWLTPKIYKSSNPIQ